MNNVKELRDAFSNPGSFASTLVVAVVAHYGLDALTWEAETLRREIEDDFRIKFSDELLARLMAGIAITASDVFYTNLPDFIQLCNILSGDTYDPTVFDPADAEEVAWGVTEALLLNPPDDDHEEPFVPEIIGYIQEIVAQEGMLQPPDVLRLGIKDPDAFSNVQTAWTDDPIMIGAINQFEQERTEDINNMLDRKSVV